VIPPIFRVLQRIENYHSKIFGTMDLPGTYHQPALAVLFQEYTAFITPRDIYEFTRVPFGLLGAPSYFQELIRN
jgi:putative transposase